MKKEIAQARLKETQNQIKQLQKKAKELKPKAKPENFFDCADCGETNPKPMFMRAWNDLHLCYICKNKRAQKEKEDELKEMLLDGKVVEVSAECSIFPNFISLVVEQNGTKYCITAGSEDLEIEEIGEEE